MKFEKKRKIVIIAIIVIVTVGIISFIYKKIIDNKYEKTDRNQLAFQKNVTVDDLKKDVGLTGNTEIYEIGQEYDGRKSLIIKSSIKFKVAFAGMIKQSIPSMEELDIILDEKLPKENGIWIEENSRNKIIELVNNNTNSKYYIDESGYLKIAEKNNQTDIDKKLEMIINGNNQVILDNSSVCYIIDDVTGEVLDYNFENMDKFQTYEYFQDKNKIIIFINENSDNQLTEKDILESIINLL